MMDKLRNDRDGGFSVIEVLVAMALTSLVAVMIFGGFGSGRQALRRTEEAQSEINLEHGMALVRGLISEIRPVPVERASGGEAVLTGNPAFMMFISSYNAQSQTGGLRHNTLSAVRRPGGRLDLVLTQRLVRPSSESWRREAASETVLAEGIAAVRFSFYGRRDADSSATWQNAWRSALTLPEIVDMRVSFAPGDHRQRRALVIPVALAAH